MQGSSYFRHQADRCSRLSASCTDQILANRFHALAEEFMAKAAGANPEDEGHHLPLAHMLKREGLAGLN